MCVCVSLNVCTQLQRRTTVCMRVSCGVQVVWIVNWTVRAESSATTNRNHKKHTAGKHFRRQINYARIDWITHPASPLQHRHQSSSPDQFTEVIVCERVIKWISAWWWPRARAEGGWKVVQQMLSVYIHVRMCKNISVCVFSIASMRGVDCLQE